MRDVPDLSDLQLAIMNVLWKQREATAAEVQAALPDRGLAITTVSTLLTRLEKRGVVKHRAEGRTFIYRAAVAETEVRRTMLGALVTSLFSGNATEVLSHLLTADDVSAGDLDQMQKLIEARRRKRGPAGG
jgi:BlaI family transcriptional regulator, penicillinase repressor